MNYKTFKEQILRSALLGDFKKFLDLVSGNSKSIRWSDIYLESGDTVAHLAAQSGSSQILT